MPVSGRRSLAHPLAARGASIAARHLRGNTALVEKHQLLRIELAYPLPPRLTPQPAYVGVLFTGVQRFFYAAVPNAATIARSAICSTVPRRAHGGAAATPRA